MYPYIYIFNKEITTYIVMTLIGILIVGFLIVRRSNKYNFDDNIIITLLLFSLLGAFIGSHLLYAIVNIPLIIKVISNIDKITSFEMFLDILRVIFGGSVFYGGLYGGLIGGFWYVKKKKLDIKLVSFIITPFIPLFHFFGRIGCFLYGCCFGIESKFGFLYYNHFDHKIVRRFPVQLLEASLNLCLFLILIWLSKKKKINHNILVIYLIMYALIRFFIEFLRGDVYRGIYFGLSTSQWISITTIIGCTIYYLKQRKKQF